MKQKVVLLLSALILTATTVGCKKSGDNNEKGSQTPQEKAEQREREAQDNADRAQDNVNRAQDELQDLRRQVDAQRAQLAEELRKKSTARAANTSDGQDEEDEEDARIAPAPSQTECRESDCAQAGIEGRPTEAEPVPAALPGGHHG